MTDNEIIKALECCSNQMYSCTDKQCRAKTLGNAVDLINRLQAENKDLAETIHNLTIEKDALFDKAEELKAEIERLQEKSRSDDKLLNDRVQEAVDAVSKTNKKYVDALEKTFNDRTAELKNAKSEIEELKSVINGFRGYDEEIKSEAVKEFAAIVSHDINAYCEKNIRTKPSVDGVTGMKIAHNLIYKRLREMEGENNGY